MLLLLVLGLDSWLGEVVDVGGADMTGGGGGGGSSRGWREEMSLPGAALADGGGEWGL